MRETPETPWNFEEFAARTYDNGLLFEPGAGWAYSNPGYMLLKRIAEQVGGASYAELIQSRIARPLGLACTFVPESIAELAPLAPATSRLLAVRGDARDIRTSYHPGWVSHGVVASTASDVVAFYRALFCGQLVSKGSVEALTDLVSVPEAPARWRRPSYGLGLMADPVSPFGPIWGHSGGGPGYSTSAFHGPGFRAGPITIAAMCAIEEGSLAETLVFELLELLAS